MQGGCENGEEAVKGDDTVNTEVTAEAAQELINEIFPGLSMFVRDVSSGTICNYCLEEEKSVS